MSNHSAQKAFKTLLDKRFADVPAETVREFALSMWYDGFVPDVSRFRKPEKLAKAGYLLERLLAFHCVTPSVRQNVKVKLAFLENKTSKHHEMYPLSTVLKRNRAVGDPLAERWGVKDTLKKQVQELLPYQTRHYKQGESNPTP